MQLWEYVLRADSQHDLSRPAAAVRWMAREQHGFPYHPAWAGPGEEIPRCSGLDDLPAEWPVRLAAEWRAAVHTLRDLARRLKGDRTGRAPAISVRRADEVFLYYVGELKVD